MQSSKFGLLRSGVLALAVMAAPGCLLAQNMITVAPPPPSEGPVERPVTFSEAQAERGNRAYDRYCLLCHGKNLDDGEFGGPPLRGLSFEQSFGGLPVSLLYSYIESTMPPDRPGQISHRDRTEIIAYLLSRNSYREGAPLPGNVDELNWLMLEK